MKTAEHPAIPATRVLIADDSATQLELTRGYLSFNGFEVEVARDGAEAMEKSRRFKPDVVVTDIVMPGMTGYELCKRMKADPELSHVGVVLLTALSDPVDVVRGLECGADNFIVKPCSEELLVSRVAKIRSTQLQGSRLSDDGEIEVTFCGREFRIGANRLHILNMLLTTYETAVQRNLELERTQRELQELSHNLEMLVLERTAKLAAEVDERKRAEEALQKQTNILRSVVASMGDALIVVDEAGRLKLSNPAAAEILGINGRAEAADRWDGGVLTCLIDGQTPCPHERLPLVRALRGDRVESQEFYVTVSGREKGVYVSVTARPIRSVDGSVRGAVAVYRDITHTRRMNEELLRAQRMESIGALAGGIAHDLNNVLSPILMGVELLRLSPTKEKADKFLDTIQLSARRGSNLVKQILVFARGSGDGERRAVRLKDVIKELVDVTRTTFPKTISVATSVEPDLWPVLGDATQLDQVLLNLCVNARDAMPSGGAIRIIAANREIAPGDVRLKGDLQAGKYVCVSVVDNGSGIAQEHIDRIFEPFFTTKERGKGSGLGLSTTLGIIRGHGGFIDVESTPGAGASFHVYFPAAATGSAPSTAPSAVELSRGNGETVLIVDDEENVRSVAGAALAHAGYRGVMAESGAAAVTTLERMAGEVRLAIVDLSMPGMDGAATIRALRALNPKLPVIVASGREEMLGEEERRNLQVAMILPKPYSLDSLCSAIHEALGRTK